MLHPSSGKLYELSRWADRQVLPLNTLQVFKEISQSCETCMLYSPRQITFQIGDADKVRFNQTVILYNMYVESSKTKRAWPFFAYT